LGTRFLYPFEVIQKKIPHARLAACLSEAPLKKITVDALSIWGPCVIDKPNGVSLCPGRDTTLSAEENEILTLETPKAEEIARAIWQRQHTALPAECLSRHTQWRDESIPSRFWNEFLLDAHAVLLLLHAKHNDYRNARQIRKMENPIAPSPVVDPLARHCASDGPSK
jgi:hypothetical protein